ncbi:MAG: cysteine desulfurase [Candidatus Omnitrophica bacterium]|nr:cysteine desulfurase [Candidatus Omnitrophota bacterium]
MSERINFDYGASTPIVPDVKQAMMAALDAGGNPSSVHQRGQQAKRLLTQARKQVASLINAKPEELYFTSCGTESNNWALRGLFAANTPPALRQLSGQERKGKHLIVSAIEHPSISLIARRLELDGAYVTILPVDREGCVSPGDLKAAMKPDTVLVSIMLANGEVGTIEPIHELAAIAHEQGALFHTDAIAAVGSIPVDVKALNVDALSLAADQFGGPQGAAALFVREGVRILPLLEGGGQEVGARSGTESLPAIVGMGIAAEIAQQGLPERIEQLSQLRDRLQDGLNQRIEGLRINGPSDIRRVARRGAPQPPAADDADSAARRGRMGCAATGPAEGDDEMHRRLPHNLHVCIDGVASEALVLGLDHAGIAVGLGSACNSKAMRPSHVLKAMGLTDEQAKGALVLTVGEPTTEDDIDRALEIIPVVVQRLRNVTALTAR